MTTILKILASAIFFLLGFFGPTLGVYVLERNRILHTGFLIDNPRLLVVFLGSGVAAAVMGWRIGTRILPQKRAMRIALNTLGVILVVLGGIWFLQGIGVLPGSFMTGQIRWAVYGGIAIAAGISMLVALRDR